MAAAVFRVGLSGDFRGPAGRAAFDAQAWRWLTQEPGLEVEVLDQPPGTPIEPAEAARFEALVIKRNRIDERVLAAAPRLRLVARNGVGFDHIDVSACTRAGVMATLTAAAVARPVASAIVAMILAFAHRLPERDRRTRAGQWMRRWEDPGFGLTGRTLGVVWLEGIGCELLRLVAPWQMRHLACTPRPLDRRHEGLAVERVPLHELLARSDIVALCCPLDEQTRGLIGREALARMPPHAILVNAARGGIVDEAALVAALQSGHLGGAALDVFATEPLDVTQGSRFANVPNLILTPHIAGVTEESNVRVSEVTARTVLAHLDGKTTAR